MLKQYYNKINKLINKDDKNNIALAVVKTDRATIFCWLIQILT